MGWGGEGGPSSAAPYIHIYIYIYIHLYIEPQQLYKDVCFNKNDIDTCPTSHGFVGGLTAWTSRVSSYSVRRIKALDEEYSAQQGQSQSYVYIVSARDKMLK